MASTNFECWLVQNGKSQGYWPTEYYHQKELIYVHENDKDHHGRYQTELCIEDSCDFIRRNANADKPFFLCMAYSIRTAPMFPPSVPQQASLWDQDEKTYASMIEFMGSRSRKRSSHAQENDLERNTIVFFASDNGPRSEATEQQTKVVNFFSTRMESIEDTNGISTKVAFASRSL